ncbi:MAG TPA: MBOAT family O-acyltransferase [Sedimentisphaerales bacterium]|nr:MBOAT family O-acyltransferase [Sedimentisphaerales bacterium]
MLFNSVEYVLFLAGIVLAYFLLPPSARVWLLLIASYAFYMRWRWEYGFLLFAVTLVNYLAGLVISATPYQRRRTMVLAGAVSVSIGLLGFFKYLNFVNDSLRSLAAAGGFHWGIPDLDILLPVGISFFTFQAVGYTIDVYRGTCPAEKHLGRFCLYVAFFPQLVAGPIERASNLLAQLTRRNHLDLDRLTSGVKLIVWGLFKKVVIADNLAVYVNRVYEAPSGYSGATLLLATYFFAFQIYCDFSGYSDIAVGSARLLGYDLMQNFRLPYLATSVRDFWKRWHISLSSWFADYVYIPLGGNRVPILRWAGNILVVFLVSGLWHGANWTFVVWGGLHGVYYLVEAVWQRFVKPHWSPGIMPAAVARPAKILVTFHLVLLAWVFFRAGTVSDAVLILSRILTDLGGRLYLGPSQLATFVSVLLIVVLLVVQVLQSHQLIILYAGASRLPRGVRWSGYLAMLYALALLGRGAHEFIYFQF